MDTKFRLLTVTGMDSKKLFSAPVGQITGISHGRFTNTGRILLSSGGHVDTVETYAELVSQYTKLTDVPE